VTTRITPQYQAAKQYNPQRLSRNGTIVPLPCHYRATIYIIEYSLANTFRTAKRFGTHRVAFLPEQANQRGESTNEAGARNRF
jgi:hypothetical protein